MSNFCSISTRSLASSAILPSTVSILFRIIPSSWWRCFNSLFTLSSVSPTFLAASSTSSPPTWCRQGRWASEKLSCGCLSYSRSDLLWAPFCSWRAPGATSVYSAILLVALEPASPRLHGDLKGHSHAACSHESSGCYRRAEPKGYFSLQVVEKTCCSVAEFLIPFDGFPFVQLNPKKYCLIN